MINFSEINRLTKLVDRAKADRLVAFVAEDPETQLKELRQSYLDELLTRAKNYGVNFIYVGKGEISGCEKVKNGIWHAMWIIAEEMGFPESCGNGDQYQCMGSERVFPEDSYGGWDLETMSKLTDDETETKKFFRVVTGKRY